MALWIGTQQTRAPDETQHLKQKCENLKKENEVLKKQVQALTEQAAFHENIFMEIAGMIYA